MIRQLIALFRQLWLRYATPVPVANVLGMPITADGCPDWTSPARPSQHRPRQKHSAGPAPHCQWQPPEKLSSLYREFRQRLAMDDSFRREHNQLQDQWMALRQFSLDSHVMPFHMMPRTITGDIAGTLGTLRFAMAHLVGRIALGRPYAVPIPFAPRPNPDHTVPGHEAVQITGMDWLGVITMLEAGELTPWGEIAEPRFTREELVEARKRIHIIEFYEAMSPAIRQLEEEDLWKKPGCWERFLRG